jgi:hypothetical protein
MIEDDPVAAAPVKQRGWPKGKPRGPRKPVAVSPIERPPEPAPIEREPKRRHPHDEPVWVDTIDPMAEDTLSPLQFSPELLAKLPAELSFRWVRIAINGQPDPMNRANAERTRWQPVFPWYFNGALDGLYAARGDTKEISYDGTLVLMARRQEITDRARAVELKRAREQLLAKEMQFTGGGLEGVSLDASHPSAVKSNRINKSFERIEVPKE